MFLDFASYQRDDPLHLNRYNILEPENKNILSPENLDLVIVPLLGFDLQGHRLGMGGGYYDRTFAFLSGKQPTKPILIGLGFADQQINSLPSDSWDVPLAGVLTEEKLNLIIHEL
jgi:5-formyltetrahydrofolate cyclo-ligase